MAVAVGPPFVTIHYNDEFCVCELNGDMSSTKEQGYFASDTRLVSGYRLKLGRERPELLNGAAVALHSARFEFTNPLFFGNDGTPIREHAIHLRLDRAIGPGLHEDYHLSNHATRRGDLHPRSQSRIRFRRPVRREVASAARARLDPQLLGRGRDPHDPLRQRHVRARPHRSSGERLVATGVCERWDPLSDHPSPKGALAYLSEVDAGARMASSARSPGPATTS